MVIGEQSGCKKHLAIGVHCQFCCNVLARLHGKIIKQGWKEKNKRQKEIKRIVLNINIRK